MTKLSTIPSSSEQELGNPESRKQIARNIAEKTIRPPALEVLSMTLPPIGKKMKLARKFAITSFAILLLGMLCVSYWVSYKIEIGVVNNSGASGALYMESFVTPLLQELDGQPRQISSENRARLDRLMAETSLGERVVSFKIWAHDGYIVYSSRPELIGVVYPETEPLLQAWNGQVNAEFDQLNDEEDSGERTTGLPLLEIYTPIRSDRDGSIIAVAEFYSLERELSSELFRAKLESWILFGVAGLIMFFCLSGIVLQGSRTIDLQQRKLSDRVNELSELRNRLEKASRRSTELNESFLRRVGSDLHDGPGQLVALALLRLDRLKDLYSTDQSAPTSNNDVEIVHDALAESLEEIRNISAGLTLPQLDGLNLQQSLQKAALAHSRRTSVIVEVQFDRVPDHIPQSIQICLYRFVQETLFNAFHHGGTDRAILESRYNDGLLEVTVSDPGVGFDLNTALNNSTGLGLSGLRQRIESVGGFFAITSREGEGTKVVAQFIVGEDV